MELVATARDWSTVNEFIQEQTWQVLVRYGRVKAPAVEPIIIKYKYTAQLMTTDEFRLSQFGTVSSLLSRIRYDTNTIKVRAPELNKNRVNNIYPRWIICVWLDEDRCLIRWTRFPNSNVAGGIVILARDLRDCQDACANSPNCTGVDWNATATAGRRCWMIGPWSAPQMNNGTAKGVDHYRIERPTDCDGKKVIFHCSTRIKVTV